MIAGKIMKWGNSYGLRIPKKTFLKMNMKENQEVLVDIKEMKNPLELLFGAGREHPISRETFLKNRRLLEGEW